MNTPPEEITCEIFDQILAWNGKEKANELARSISTASYLGFFVCTLHHIYNSKNYTAVGYIYDHRIRFLEKLNAKPINARACKLVPVRNILSTNSFHILYFHFVCVLTKTIQIWDESITAITRKLINTNENTDVIFLSVNFRGILPMEIFPQYIPTELPWEKNLKQSKKKKMTCYFYQRNYRRNIPLVNSLGNFIGKLWILFIMSITKGITDGIFRRYFPESVIWRFSEKIQLI
jgi:hypothetical protein